MRACCSGWKNSAEPMTRNCATRWPSAAWARLPRPTIWPACVACTGSCWLLGGRCRCALSIVGLPASLRARRWANSPPWGCLRATPCWKTTNRLLSRSGVASMPAWPPMRQRARTMWHWCRPMGAATPAKRWRARWPSGSSWRWRMRRACWLGRWPPLPRSFRSSRPGSNPAILCRLPTPKTCCGRRPRCWARRRKRLLWTQQASWKKP